MSVPVKLPAASDDQQMCLECEKTEVLLIPMRISQIFVAKKNPNFQLEQVEAEIVHSLVPVLEIQGGNLPGYLASPRTG